MSWLILLTMTMIGLALWQRRTHSARLTPVLWFLAILTMAVAARHLFHRAPAPAAEVVMYRPVADVPTSSVPTTEPSAPATIPSPSSGGTLTRPALAMVPQPAPEPTSSWNWPGVRPRPAEVPKTVALYLGRAVAADAPKTGDIIVMQMPTYLAGRLPFHENHVAGLREALHGTSLRLVGYEDRPELSNAWARVFHGAKMDADLVNAYLQAYPGAVAIVSFEGLPGCKPSDLAHTPPPFYALGNQYDLANTAWQDSGLVRGLITEILPQR